MTFERPSWDSYGLVLASAAASRAACTRRQVGAAILDSSHFVLSTGYNGTATGTTNCSDGGCPRGQLTYDQCPAYSGYSNCTGRHAEDNAIRAAQRSIYGSVALHGSTIYVTHAPCEGCDARIRKCGISRAVWEDKENGRLRARLYNGD